MIRIVVNGKDLDLGDISIALHFKNPLFSSNAFDEAFSYKFKIDDTPRNRVILDHVERIDSRNKVKRYRGAKLYFQGIKIFNCTLITGETTNRLIPCNIINDGLDIAKELAAFKIRDLEYDPIEIYDVSDTPQDKQAAVNLHMTDNLDEAMIDPKSVDHYFPPIFSRYAWDLDKADSVGFVSGFSENHWWSHYFNHHVGLGYFMQTAVHKNLWENADKQGFSTSFAPVPRIIPVLNRIMNHFGIKVLDSQILELEEVQRMFVFAAVARNSIEQQLNYYYNVYTQQYSLDEFLPDVDGLSFVKIFKDLYGCVILKNKDSIEYLTPNEILQTDSIDFTKYSNPDYVNEVQDRNRYILAWEEDGTDSYFVNGDEFSEVLIEPESFEKDVENKPFTRPLATFVETQQPQYANSLGQIKQSGTAGSSATLNIVAYNFQVKDDYSENSPKDVVQRIYLGIWRDPLTPVGLTLIRTSNIIETSTPPDVAGEFSILWGGEEGLLNQHWRPLIDFVNGSMRIKKTLYLPIHKVLQMMDFRNPKHTFYTDKGMRTGILESFSLTLTMKGMSPVRAEYLSKIIYDQ